MNRPPVHGRGDHRDGSNDQISGPWLLILDEGDDPPDELANDDDAIEGEDYLFLENGAIQPAPGSGPDGEDLEEFAIRRGLSRLDAKGHVDVNAFSSGDVFLTVPEWLAPPTSFFRLVVVYDGSTPQAAMMLYNPTSRALTLTFPL